MSSRKTADPLAHGQILTDVHVHRLYPHIDERGSFTEVFSLEWEPDLNTRQWSLVKSEAGTCRGMHVHRHHDECYFVLSGHAYLGLYDIRRGSPTEGQSMMLELTGEPPYLITLTRGILHGWCFVAPSSHFQGVSRTYSEYHPDDNLGCDLSDPDLALPWPDVNGVRSDRARAFPSLRELLARVSIDYDG